MRAGLVGLLVIVVVAAVIALNSLFIVNPTQQALVLQFGEVRQAIREPGLNAKIPLVQDVRFLDRRILDLNVPAQEIIAADQKRLVVDAFMRYRIADPVRFYQTVNNVREGASRLSTFVQASLRAVLADATFQQIVRDDRPELMHRIRTDVAGRADDIGVEIVDVRIRRADLPEANSEAIYRRMQTERQQEAREIRAKGQEAAQRLRAAADRTATVLRAEADRESEQIRGLGDAQKNAIFAAAYGQDPQFFAFYRAMSAYEGSLSSEGTRLVLSPEAEFFRYFNDPMGALRGLSVGEAAKPATESGEAAPVDMSEVLPEAAGGDGDGDTDASIDALRERINEIADTDRSGISREARDIVSEEAAASEALSTGDINVQSIEAGDDMNEATSTDEMIEDAAADAADPGEVQLPAPATESPAATPDAADGTDSSSSAAPAPADATDGSESVTTTTTVTETVDESDAPAANDNEPAADNAAGNDEEAPSAGTAAQ